LSLANGELSANIALLLFMLGASVGLLGAFFGVGGGWIITPALMILGLKEQMAVGTGFGYIMGMSIISTWKHRRNNNLELKLSLLIAIPMLIGVGAGKLTLKHLGKTGQSEHTIQLLYIILLTSLGSYMFYNTLKHKLKNKAASPHKKAPLERNKNADLVIHLPKSHRTILAYPVIIMGIIIGFLSGFMGLGGGFIIVPIMIYLLGIPVPIAVGSSLLCLTIASPVGLFLNSIDHCVIWKVSAIMVAGAVIGAPAGVYASSKVKGEWLKFLYAGMCFMGGIAVLLKFLKKTNLSIITIFGSVATLVLLILIMLITQKNRTTTKLSKKTTQ